MADHAAAVDHVAHQFDDAEQQKLAAELGMWLFLATEVMFFGGMILAYTVFRYEHPAAFENPDERHRRLDDFRDSADTCRSELEQQFPGDPIVDLWERAVEPAKNALARLAAGQPLVIAAGPEGGLEAAEVEVARALGFDVVSLGPFILRTETVAAAVLGATLLLKADEIPE